MSRPSQDAIEQAPHVPGARRRHRAQLIERKLVGELPGRGPKRGIVGVMREPREYRAESVGIVPHFPVVNHYLALCAVIKSTEAG